MLGDKLKEKPPNLAQGQSILLTRKETYALVMFLHSSIQFFSL